MIPGSANPLLLKSAAAAGGLQIERSLRFNSSDSAYLSRTPGTAGNRRTWTWAGWVKKVSNSNTLASIFTAGTSGAYYDAILFSLDGTTDKFGIGFSNSAGNGSSGSIESTQVLRDVSAWYHLVVAVDTTQGTASNRVKLYVNGQQITDLSTANYPSLNFDCSYFNNANQHAIGTGSGAYFQNRYLNAYLTNIHFIDGQALTPSSFTETDATTGQLIPKTYTGTYGTNGFNLLFADNSSNTASTLGKDTSGNSNNWTPNNLSTSTGGPTSVAAATGALPVFNTTDTYGTVKGTGTRTDTNSASIVLALPMDGANNGTSFGDQSAVIKGSGSAKTVTVNGNAKTSTAQSTFYGSSGLFDGTGDFLDITPTTDFALPNDFTIEAWAYNPVLANLAIFSIGSYTTGLYFRIGEGGDSTRATVYINNSQIALSASGSVKAAQWNHFAVVRSGSAVNIYVNGVSIASGTSSYSIPAATTYVGRAVHSTGEDMNGYVQDVRVYKGVAKYTSSFNPPSSTANPTVAAGNDSLVDSPTNYGTDTGVGGEVRGNYCTLNPLDKNPTCVLSNGNLDNITNINNWSGGAKGTIGMSSGKWYFEVNAVYDTMLGIGNAASSLATPAFPGYSPGSYGYYHNGNKFYNNVSSAYGATYGPGDVIGIAFDADNLTLTYYKNGVSQGVAFSSIPSGTYFPYVATYTSISCNFGQRAFAYTAPSGFKALCTQNLPAPLVTKSNTVFDVTTYTGTGAALTPTNSLGFNPDWIWIKSRSAATDHALYDVVRGAQARLESNTTDAEVTTDGGVTAFNSAGFTLGTLAQVNTSAATYVAWAWDAGTSTVSNTAGSITSQVRANASAGFSIVSWTGNGTLNASVGHGLGVLPKLRITKNRTTGSTSWPTHTTVIDGSLDFLFLNTTAGKGDSGENTDTSSVFHIYGDTAYGASGQNYITYCFAPVVGFSSFGSYTGNGSTDGVFVYTGLRPRWVMIKGSSFAGESWFIWDTARNTYNQMGARLLPNESLADNSDQVFGDILSNGFKLRNTWGGINGSGNTYIYAAFAEAPINYSRAR